MIFLSRIEELSIDLKKKIKKILSIAIYGYDRDYSKIKVKIDKN